MFDTTSNLALPYILPSQAQKHVTHNEALQRLDAIVQLCVDAEATNPPSDPVEGQCYLVADGAGGDWTGKDGLLAFRQDGAWIYLEPRMGWRAFFAQLGQIHVFSGGLWRPVSLDAEGSVPMIGINASPDNVNRLSIASPASLFNHAGQGHQIKVNKASASETGSLVFQTEWSGRAEIGLTGNDDFSIKVSSDGSDWQTALAISPAGIVKMPARPMARTALAQQTATPAPGGRTGFDEFNLLQGGFTLGAIVPSGTGYRLIVPASGLYLLLLTADTNSSSGHGAAIEANGTTLLASTGGSASAMPARHTAFTLASLNAGDWLALVHSGSALYEFGAGKTELSVLML
ncbi:DUF2793 domain-containing protein [Rhizobium sp. Root1220]|uniref:DUF2793 domain-containing protein n=1 Tax=Rhizobium sp. Root1220 TaxID=1736432 RepID=UPI0006FF084D|nr:DUF2793 domain-containing protein [Rhizobium sp. Root1220]KQV83758.1 hypothetical protein ASC90_19025 [Rhizobium sp. Root1220]